MLRFDFTIVYIPGKNLMIADALSRALLRKPDENDRLVQEETKAYVDSVIQDLPATELRRRLISSNAGRFSLDPRQEGGRDGRRPSWSTILLNRHSQWYF